LLRPRERLAESGLQRSAPFGSRPGRRGRPGRVLLAEPLHTPGGVHQLLLPREVRVAAGADFDVDRGHGGPRHEVIAAGALDRGALISGVNPGFHSSASLTESRTARSAE